jgi:hypothetical protein
VPSVSDFSAEAAEIDYRQIAMARASDGHISVEDVIVHKLIAWRGRDQDDIRSMLEAGRPPSIATTSPDGRPSGRSPTWAEAQTWR